MSRRMLAVAAVLLSFPAGIWLVAEESRLPKSGDVASDKKSASAGDIQQTAATVTSITPPPPAVTARDPRILFITEPDNEQCMWELIKLRRPGGAFEAMKARGWKIGPGPENHVQVVDRTQIPDLVKELNVREYPSVACLEKGQIVRYFKDGCTTPLDQWTFGWLISGRNERPPEAVLEAARVASTGSYRLRGNHWSVDGNWNPSRQYVISHLRGPNHAHRLLANYQIENWSLEELRSLHDDLHESEVGAASVYQSPAASRGGSNLGAGRKIQGL